MIWESSFWKDDLLKTAARLSKKMHQRRWTERSFVIIEKDVFISLYTIRKLIEARKLSDCVASLIIPVTCYPSKGKPITLMNWDRVDDLYHFDNGKHNTIELGFLCNQIIHSYVFSPSFNESGELCGFFFCSDRQRNQNVYEVSVLDIIKVLNQLGSNYPSESHMEFDTSKQDYVISNK